MRRLQKRPIAIHFWSELARCCSREPVVRVTTRQKVASKFNLSDSTAAYRKVGQSNAVSTASEAPQLGKPTKTVNT